MNGGMRGPISMLVLRRIWGTFLLDSILLKEVMPDLRKRILACAEKNLQALLALYLEYEEASKKLRNTLLSN
jgi:hypothetical protein